MTTREIGNKGEDITCEYLLENNYEIIKRNYTIKGGEVDIIAIKGEIIAFVEVKTRAKNSLVSGYEAITKSKKNRIFKTAQHYFTNNSVDFQPRFDVAIIEKDQKGNFNLNYIENAFDMSDSNIYF